MLSLFSTINLVCVPEINIFGNDRIFQIWIISFKDINIQWILKIVTNGHQYIKTTADKNLIFWINSHYPTEKQSNQDWNISIHLESNGPHIKFPLTFWFLIMIFYFCFYHQLWVKWLCIDIGNSSGHIGQTHSRFPKYLWMFDTEWKAHQIDILDNLFN